MLPHASEYVDELITAFEEEQDTGLQSWLLELLGEAGSPRAIPFLQRMLEHEHFELQAINALRMIDTKEARTILYHHSQKP